MSRAQSKKTQQDRPDRMTAVRRLCRQISAIDLICRGTLSRRMMTCGKSNCRCTKDPSARHGPYYEWTRMENGRFLHAYVSPVQAKLIAGTIKNYQRVTRLLSRWRQLSTRKIMEI